MKKKTPGTFRESFFNNAAKIDELVKSRETPFLVIPAKAGIQLYQMVPAGLDSGFHRSEI